MRREFFLQKSHTVQRIVKLCEIDLQRIEKYPSYDAS